MHWLVVGCLILATILVACGGDTEEVTEADALYARLDAIEATLASSTEVPAATTPLTPPLTLTPALDTAQSAGPDAIRVRQAELRAAEADAEASLVAASADIATRWAERQLLFDSCMVTELEEAEYAELLGLDMGSIEWANFMATVIEGPLRYLQQGMLADRSWWKRAADMGIVTPLPAPAVTPEPTRAAMPMATGVPTHAAVATSIATPDATTAATPAAMPTPTAEPMVMSVVTPAPMGASALLGDAERRHTEAMASAILGEMRLMLLCWYVATSDA